MIQLPSSHMPALTVRDISPELYQRLKRQAEDNRRSLSAEILVILERSLMASRDGTDPFLAEAEALRKRLGRSFPDISKEDYREGLP